MLIGRGLEMSAMSFSMGPAGSCKEQGRGAAHCCPGLSAYSCLIVFQCTQSLVDAGN